MGANPLNILLAFFKPACILIFSGAFFNLKKIIAPRFFAWGSQKASSPRTLYIILWLNLGLKPQERETNKRLDLGQDSVGA